MEISESMSRKLPISRSPLLRPYISKRPAPPLSTLIFALPNKAATHVTTSLPDWFMPLPVITSIESKGRGMWGRKCFCKAGWR